MLRWEEHEHKANIKTQNSNNGNEHLSTTERLPNGIMNTLHIRDATVSTIMPSTHTAPSHDDDDSLSGDNSDDNSDADTEADIDDPRDRDRRSASDSEQEETNGMHAVTREETNESDAAAADADSRVVKRVKVYHLNDVGQWEDKGTGHVTVLNPTQSTMTIVVKNEPEIDVNDPTLHHQNDTDTAHEEPHLTITPTPNILLHHRLTDGLDYQRQGETIVTWCESTTGADIALSFQDSAGCSAIWSLITALNAENKGRQRAGGV